MRTNRILARSLIFASALAAFAVVAAPAQAQVTSPVAGRMGFGIVEALGLPSFGGGTGINGVYDAGPWHADATLRFADVGASDTALGVHGWFHLHQGSSADFSLGGGLGYRRINPEGPSASASFVGIDIGFQIRVFVTANVAVGARAGLQVLTGDDDGFALGGEGVGDFSLTYFF